MRVLVASPYSGAPAIELSGDRWRKKVLPVGEVAYKGRMLRFDRSYLTTLADAFTAGAYGQVPFQLADADNRHTNDPERYRGEVTAMSVEPDGLYITVETTPEGSRLLQVNPNLGISARIIEQYDRSDGAHFPAAVQHVLGTLDPRIPALGAWEPATDLSSADDQGMVPIDLSTCNFAGEPAPEPGDATPGGGQSLYDVLAEYLEPDELAVFAEHGEEALLEYLQAKDNAGLLDDGKPQQRQPAQIAQTTQYANDDLSAAIELAASQAAARLAEDAAPMARRDENRLATALARIGRGTYLPTTEQRALGFATPSEAGRALAEARWAPQDTAAGVTAGCSCGAIAADGSTVAAHHLAGCDTQDLTPDDWAAVASVGVFAEMARQPASDSRGSRYADQYGRPMDLTGLLESVTGQRLTRDEPFGGLAPRREILIAQRQSRLGDPDAPDDPGSPFPYQARQAAAAAAEQMGIAPRSTSDARNAALARLALQPARHRQMSYGQALDYGESTRERAERLHQPAVPVEFGDEPVAGSLRAYRAA